MYTGCLSEAAYYIESNGEAIIIDPIRETEPYTEISERRGAKIKYVLETHFHADFVSGHIDLAAKTGATIVYGPGATPEYDAHIAKDGEILELGEIKIKVMHTPGHTPESSCYLLFDKDGNEHAVFTGDTLFVGDVGRPDLAIKSDLTEKDLAGMLYDSLNRCIKILPDNVIVYPAHGAGSSCGKNIGKETFSTIGEQKKNNYALQDMTKEAFVEVVTEGLSAPPKYFFMDAGINKKGYKSIDSVMEDNLKLLEPNDFENAIKADDALLLDARNQDVFELGFIPGSINIGLDGQYAIWVGTLLDANKKIFVIADPGREYEAVLRLARVGYENVSGVLMGGIENWKKAGKKIDTITSIEPSELKELLKSNINILDVRNKGEWSTGVLDGAELSCLSDIDNKIESLDKNKKYYVHCAGGYRSMIAASIMKKNGINNVVNIHKGMTGIKKENIPVLEPSN